MKKDNKIESFRQRHPILVNLLLMVLASIVLVYAALLFIDVFTAHGQERRVPDVRNLSLGDAIERIEQAGMEWDISDSASYDANFKPGVVIDQNPKADSYVKAIRVIYLKVNAMHDRMVAMPHLTDMSWRQAQALLRTHGFRDVTIDSVHGPSSSRGVVLQAKVDGRSVRDGSQVLVSSHVLLIVCDGEIDDTLPDTASNAVIDSVEIAARQRELQARDKEQQR